MSDANVGYLLAFLAMFIGSMSNFPFTDVARKWGSVAVNHFRLLVGFIVLTAVCMVIDKISFTELFTGPSAMQYLYMGSSGIIGLVIGDYFAFHSMAILGARQYSIFNTLSPGAALLFGYLILSEDIDFIGIAGILISIAGMIWFLKSGKEKKLDSAPVDTYGSIKKGVLFGILSGLVQGFHITLSKKGMFDASVPLSPIHATWIRVFAATAGYFLFTFSRGKLTKDVIVVIRRQSKQIPKAIYSTIFGMALSVVLVMWSIQLCKVAVAQTILSMVPIVAVPAAYFLYKEKITMSAIAAALVSILGVVILIWRQDIAAWAQLHLFACKVH